MDKKENMAQRDHKELLDQWDLKYQEEMDLLDHGNPGLPGPKGDPGLDGISGVQGLTRPKENQGDLGPVGSKGNTGAPGAWNPKEIEGMYRTTKDL